MSRNQSAATEYFLFPGGLQVQGRLSLFGYRVQALFAVELIWGFPRRILMDFEIDPISFGPFFQIRRFAGSSLGPKVR